MIKFENYLWVFEVLGLALIIASLVFYLVLIPLSRSKVWPKLGSPQNIRRMLWGLFFGGFLIYSALQLSIYYTLGSPMRDVSIFDQAIWHLSRFQLPASTIREMANLWGDHFHPIILLIVPFYWLKSDVRWLFIIQAAVVSAGVFPIFGIARDKLKSNFAGLCFAFSWLFYLGIQHAIRFGFYPETLAITFLAFALSYFFQKKIIWYFIFVILALVCKENISLYIAFLGIWILIFTRQRWLGLATIILGLAWFKLIIGFLMPHFAGFPYYYFRYEQLGDTPFTALKTIIRHPKYTLRIAFSPEIKITSWLYYFTPFAFLPIFSSFVLVLIPVMAEKFLSTDPQFWTMGYHYGASAATFLVVTAILALSNILNLKQIKRIKLPDKLKPSYIGLILVVLALIITFRNPTDPFYRFFDKNLMKFSFPDNYQKAIALIPQDKSLTAQMTLGTALAHRKEIYWWSDYPNQKKGDFILLSCNYATFPYDQKTHLERIRALISGNEYGIRFSEGDIILLEKGLKENYPLSDELKNCLSIN